MTLNDVPGWLALPLVAFAAALLLGGMYQLDKRMPRNRLLRFFAHIYLLLADSLVSLIGCFSLAVVAQALFIGLIVLIIALVIMVG